MSIILIGNEPVIGTLLEGIQLVESRFFFGEPRFRDWYIKMHNRVWNWLPRFYGGYYGGDRNPDGEYEERRNDITEVYVPDGFSIPPDGWLIKPRFDGDRCIGQQAVRFKGVAWKGDGIKGLRPAEMTRTGEYTFVPLHVYYKES